MRKKNGTIHSNISSKYREAIYVFVNEDLKVLPLGGSYLLFATSLSSTKNRIPFKILRTGTGTGTGKTTKLILLDSLLQEIFITKMVKMAPWWA